MALLALAAAFRKGIDIIPAVGMKRVDQRWRTHDELYLVLVHARLQPGQHFVVDDGALLDVDSIHARQFVSSLMSAGREEKSECQ